MISQRKMGAAALVLAVAACVAPAAAPLARQVAGYAPPPIARPTVTVPLSNESAPPALAASIRALWAGFPGRAGIAVSSNEGSWLISYRGDELMPQQSVSKLWVAIAVVDQIDKGRIRLDDVVTLRKPDIAVFHSPIAAKIGENGFQTTIGDLMRRAMQQSDNTANDFLMRRAGGPEAIRAMISAKGLGAIRFGPGERLLQAKTAGLAWRPEYSLGRAFQTARAQLSDTTRLNAMNAYLASPPDGAAPSAIARALLRLKNGDLLSASGTRYLLALMAGSETGRARLRGGVPVGWTLAHKTGTGQDYKGRTAGFNDIGLLTAPDGTTYSVAVLIADSTQPVPQRQKLMQNVAAAIGQYHNQHTFAAAR